MSIIGIDSGSSITKIIETDEEGTIFNRLIVKEKDINKAIDIFIKKNNIDISNISKFITTGVGASELHENILNIPTTHIDEFIAIGEGGTYLSKRKKTVVVSIGTGTAFVKCINGKYQHIGGTGVGGGTLFNLSKKVANIDSFEDIIKASVNGKLKNIDLTIQDVTNKEIKTLPKDITSANFGKLNNNATNEDIVAGIINMVFEVIGMMAAFAVRNEEFKEVVLIGTIMTIPTARTILDKIEKIQNIKFIVPENAEYATAIGAVRRVLTKNIF